MKGSSPLIAVVTIGDELLSGEVLDTNVGAIASALREPGLRISRHVTVPDSLEEISREVRGLASSFDAVIVTGGLGPTSDDLTTEGVALGTGRELVLQPHIVENLKLFFSRLGRPMPDENLKQAYFPEGATEVPTAGGTAPGFMLEHDDALIAVLPGVPREMESMLASDVMPAICERFQTAGVIVTRRIMTFGRGESDVAKLVADRIGAGPVDYGFLVMGGPIVVKLTATGTTHEEAASLLDAEQAEVLSRLGNLMYGVDDQSMEEIVGGLLRERGMTIATAESITAGMVASRIANVPGSSVYLLGGIVAYTNEAKESLLRVPTGLLSEGAVNRPVAEAMARGAREAYSSDIAVATTGVAGPGSGGEAKPPGTVAIALAAAEGTISLEARLPGWRNMVRSIATMAALNFVRLHLLGEKQIDGW